MREARLEVNAYGKRELYSEFVCSAFNVQRIGGAAPKVQRGLASCNPLGMRRGGERQRLSGLGICGESEGQRPPRIYGKSGEQRPPGMCGSLGAARFFVLQRF